MVLSTLIEDDEAAEANNSDVRVVGRPNNCSLMVWSGQTFQTSCQHFVTNVFRNK